MRTAHYISEAKRCAGIKSDYALAKALGTRPTTVASWTSGRSVPDARFAFKLAELIGEDPVPVLAHIEIERAIRAGSEEAADYWRDYLRRAYNDVTERAALNIGKAGKAIGGTLAGLFIGGSILLTPPPVNASSIPPGKLANIEGADSVYYVNPTPEQMDQAESLIQKNRAPNHADGKIRLTRTRSSDSACFRTSYGKVRSLRPLAV